MSARFSGPQHKGASRDAKLRRQDEARMRQAEYDRLLCDELRHLRGMPKCMHRPDRKLREGKR